MLRSIVGLVVGRGRSMVGRDGAVICRGMVNNSMVNRDMDSMVNNRGMDCMVN